MSYMLFGSAPVCVFTNAFSFLNFFDVPSESNSRTGNQEGIYLAALSWGRGEPGHCVTVGMECQTSEGGIMRLGTLTRNHPSYAFSSCLTRDPVLSRRFFLGDWVHLQSGPLPWTIHGPGPDVSRHFILGHDGMVWREIPTSSLNDGLK